jgi:methionine synthase I (cobalamin-dependent)
MILGPARPEPKAVMHPLIRELTARGPVLTDGAWGTQLQARGLPIGDFPDSWNLEHPARVLEVAQAYVAAGSQIILTNTFGSNRLRLAETPWAHKIAEINHNGVALSRQAAGTKARVFASIGPTGKMLVAGDTTTAELQAVYEEQADALASASPDALVVETMSDLEEAQIAVAAACRTSLPVVACMVFDTGKDRDRTMMGITPEEAAQALAAAGAAVVGANCGQGIAAFEPICRRLRAASQLPIWIKPNAGMPEMVGGHTVYRTSAVEFASHGVALVAAGASFLGGCCGTTPEFIRELARTCGSPHVSQAGTAGTEVIGNT